MAADPATMPIELRGRLHPSYQVFAANIQLPEIRALEPDTLSVGTNLILRFSNSNPPTEEQKSALMNTLQIPRHFLDALLQRFSSNRLSGEALAREFQAAAIDYRYLQQRWDRYHPGPEGYAVKAEALKRLEAGDIQSAWQLYMDLPRPAPPIGFRVRSSQATTNRQVSTHSRG